MSLDESPRFKAFLREMASRINIPKRTRAASPRAAPRAIPNMVAVFAEDPLFADEGTAEVLPLIIVKDPVTERAPDTVTVNEFKIELLTVVLMRVTVLTGFVVTIGCEVVTGGASEVVSGGGGEVVSGGGGEIVVVVVVVVAGASEVVKGVSVVVVGTAEDILSVENFSFQSPPSLSSPTH